MLRMSVVRARVCVRTTNAGLSRSILFFVLRPIANRPTCDNAQRARVWSVLRRLSEPSLASYEVPRECGIDARPRSSTFPPLFVLGTVYHALRFFTLLGRELTEKE